MGSCSAQRGRGESWWHFARPLPRPRGRHPPQFPLLPAGREEWEPALWSVWGFPWAQRSHLTPVPPAGVQAATALASLAGGQRRGGAGSRGVQADSSRGFLGTGLGKTGKFWGLPAQCELASGFPGGSEVKAFCLECGRPGFDPWIRKIPWRRKSQPTPVLLPGESHGGRILVGYSPWGCKELDMTERLHDPSMKEK